MNIEGQLSINLYPNAESGERALIHSTRPLKASQIMIGKSPDAVLRTIPLVYRVCGVAQAQASVQAFEKALNIPENPALQLARQILIAVETVKEHLWRILIDWPAFLQSESDTNNLPRLGRLIPDVGKQLFGHNPAFSLNSRLSTDFDRLEKLIDQLEETLTDSVFTLSPEQWLNQIEKTEDAQWINNNKGIAATLLRKIKHNEWQSVGASEIDLIPRLSANELDKRLASDNAGLFISAPEWENKIYETGTLARMYHNPRLQTWVHNYGNGLITRLIARLTELAEAPSKLREMARELENREDTPDPGSNPISPPDAVGLAQVEAARGLLVHRVQLEDGQVKQYQILAPTEWNFHPRGVVTRGLSGLHASDQSTLKHQANLFINAVDPCVGYSLEVH